MASHPPMCLCYCREKRDLHSTRYVFQINNNNILTLLSEMALLCKVRHDAWVVVHLNMNWEDIPSLIQNLSTPVDIPYAKLFDHIDNLLRFYLFLDLQR